MNRVDFMVVDRRSPEVKHFIDAAFSVVFVTLYGNVVPYGFLRTGSVYVQDVRKRRVRAARMIRDFRTVVPTAVFDVMPAVVGIITYYDSPIGPRTVVCHARDTVP